MPRGRHVDSKLLVISTGSLANEEDLSLSHFEMKLRSKIVLNAQNLRDWI